MSSYPQITIKHNIGNTIDIPNQLDIRASTYITSNISTGVTTIPVENATDFSSGDILLLLSSLGSENSEIVESSASTTKSFTTDATTMAHTRGDIVNEIKYDQVVVYKSSTIDGTYTELETKTFATTRQNTIFYDSSGSVTDYYKIQWKNSITDEVSGFSEPISVMAYPINSVAKIIFPVLKAMGVSEDDPKINVEFCISAVDDARKFTEAKLFGYRHPWQQEFEHPIKLLAGNNFVNLPDDIDFDTTDRSLLSARFLVDNILTPFPLRYIDKRAWNQVSYNVMGGYNQSNVPIGGTTITLDSVGDFSDGNGTATIATTDFDQSIMTVNYTGVNSLTNQLTGVTGVTREIPTGIRVWSRPTISQPIYYTVYDNKIFFDRIIPDSMQGNNVYIDYYKKIEDVKNLYQVLPEHYREIYKWYLRYAIKYRKDNDLPSSDPDLVKFETLVQALVDNLYTGQNTIISN